jgi:hypothetical protein
MRKIKLKGFLDNETDKSNASSKIISFGNYGTIVFSQ